MYICCDCPVEVSSTVNHSFEGMDYSLLISLLREWIIENTAVFPCKSSEFS